MFRLIERCLRDGDDQAWIELWEVFEDASATEVRRILVENGVTPKDADAVVTKCWGELTKSKKTLRPLLGKSLRELKEWFVDGVVLGTFKPLEAGKVLLGELTNKKGKRVKSRSMQFETLEARQMLAADLLNFQLYEDIGAADNVSTNPTVTAVVGDLQPNAAKAAVQFDHNGDGSPEETVADLVAGNTLFYDPGDPGVTDPAFPTEGPVTLLYRVLEQDAAGVNLDTGDWQAFDFFVGDETAATPQFGNDGSYVFEVGEDVAVTTVIGSVQATDLQADLVTYSIASWSQDQPFSIDPDSGEVTVAGLLNYEANSTHYIDVLATDPYGNQSSAYLSIYVQDVEENPQFTSGGSYGSYAFEVEEEVPFGTVVGTVVATDPQGDSVIYSIAPWNEDEPFAIDPSTGEITAAARLDYEFEGSYYVDIQATDPQGNQSTAYVSIYLQNVVEEPEYGSDASGGDGYESTGYVDESSFATIDILDFLPALPSQAYAGELIYFLPDGDQNTTTTTTDFSADSYYDEDGGLHEFEQTINYTLSVTSTVLDDGTWTHQETLTSTYDYVTLDDTTDIDRWLHQWGFYNWTFIASGALDSITYSTATQGSDSYQKTYSDSWLEVNEDFSVDRETYAYESDGSDSFYDFYEASTTFATDGSYSTVYTELGDGSGQSNYAGVGTYDYLTGSGDLSAGDGSESHEWGDWQESWSDSYGYVYIGAGTITGDTSQTQTKVGTLNETGSGEGTYAYSWQGDYVRSAEYPDEEFAGGTSITQTDQWSGTETEDYDYSYDDLTTYQSDGGKTLHVLESGSESSTYIYAGTGTYQRESEEGDLWLGEGAEETYADSYTDAYSDASTFDYTDNLLWTTDPEGNATRTGTSKQVGGVSGSSTYTFASAYTYDDAYFEFNDAGYSSISQSDNTAKVWMDTWGYGYNDLTTYNLDDTYTVHVLESGDGSGSYDFADDGTYAWLAQAGDLVAGDGWKETYNDLYDGSAWDTYQYEYNKDVTKTYAPSSEDESTEGEEAVNVAKTGTYHETGNTEGGSSSTWSGTSTYDDAVPDGFEYSEVSQLDNWAGSSSSNYDSLYDDLTTYNSDGGYEVNVIEFGGGSASYISAGDGTFSSHRELGDLLAGEGEIGTYQDSYVKTAWDNYDYDYDKNITTAYAAPSTDESDANENADTESSTSEDEEYVEDTETSPQPSEFARALRDFQWDDGLFDLLAKQLVANSNETKTGTYHETGGGDSGSTYETSGSSSYQGAMSADDEYQETVQSDQWTESSTNNSDYEYEDLTTYASDGSVSKQIQQSGGGDSTWDYSANGTYWALVETGNVVAGDGWRETYSDSYVETYWDDFGYSLEKDTTATVTADLEWSKTGTREYTGGGETGGIGAENIDTTYATASTYSDGQSSSSTANHWEKTWDYVDDNLYNELITFQSDGGISYASSEFGGGNGGWDWISSGDDLDQSTWSYDGTDYNSSSDDHRSDSGFETYDYEYEDDLSVTVAADGSEAISGGWHQWGGGEGNADLHHWGASSWAEQYTGIGYSSSSYDENTYDIVSNDSYLHTFDNSGSYPDDSSADTYGGDTYVSGDYQDTSTSSGNWTETFDDDGYGGPGWTDGDSYSDSFTSNTSYDELLADASPDFWYYGYGSEQYALASDFSNIAAQAWDDALDFLTSATIEETDEEEAPPDPSSQETTDTSSSSTESVDSENSDAGETSNSADSQDNVPADAAENDSESETSDESGESGNADESGNPERMIRFRDLPEDEQRLLYNRSKLGRAIGERFPDVFGDSPYDYIRRVNNQRTDADDRVSDRRGRNPRDMGFEARTREEWHEIVRSNARQEAEEAIATLPAKVPEQAPEPQSLTKVQTLRRALEIAGLADAAYTTVKREITGGWEVVEVYDDKIDSFRAVVFRGPDGKHVLAFAGTGGLSPDAIGDWIANIRQSLGLKSSQYEKAIELTKEWNKKVGAGNLEVVGHSLGGGLASAAALVNDVRATVFNAAGVNWITLKRHESNKSKQNELISHYRVRGEILTTLQDSDSSTLGRIMPDSNGTIHNLWTNTIGPIRRHMMSDVISALRSSLSKAQYREANPTKSLEKNLRDAGDYRRWIDGFGGGAGRFVPGWP